MAKFVAPPITPHTFSNTAALLSAQLHDTEEIAMEGEFERSRPEVLRCVAYGRECLEAAGGLYATNVEGAWWWLTQASHQAGAAQASLQGAWVRPSLDPSLMGKRGGTASGQNYKAKRKAAAEAFLKLPSIGTCQPEAVWNLEQLMRANSLNANEGARMTLYREHPAVRGAIRALPQSSRSYRSRQPSPSS